MFHLFITDVILTFSISPSLYSNCVLKAKIFIYCFLMSREELWLTCSWWDHWPESCVCWPYLINWDGDYKWELLPLIDWGSNNTLKLQTILCINNSPLFSSYYVFDSLLRTNHYFAFILLATFRPKIQSLLLDLDSGTEFSPLSFFYIWIPP